MRYRIVKRRISKSEWYGSDAQTQTEVRYCAEYKSLLGWRTLRTGVEGGIKSNGYAVFKYQLTAEKIIARHAIAKDEGKPKKTVDIVAEFEYIGSTRLDRLLERIYP